jgi:thiol peroxidase
MNITFGQKPITIRGNNIKISDQAIEFSATKLDMSEFKLKPGKITLISAAPSLDTSVCSLQTIRFNHEAKALKDKLDIVSISMDLPFALRRYCQANEIENLTVLSDYKRHEFGDKYGFIMDGLELLARGVIIIDSNFIVRYVEFVSEGTNEPNYDRAISEIKTLIEEDNK